LVSKDLDQRRYEVVEISLNTFVKGSRNIRNQPTSNPDTFIIFPLECPYEILTELINIDSGPKSSYKSAESNQAIFSDPLQ
jgi:hypothetical protein